MKRVPLSVLLGLLSVFVFILAAEPFEGSNEELAIASGSLCLALYLGTSAYWMLHSVNASDPTARHIALALLLPLVAETIIVLVFERTDTFLSQGIPMLFAGCVGCVVGILMAARRVHSTLRRL